MVPEELQVLTVSDRDGKDAAQIGDRRIAPDEKELPKKVCYRRKVTFKTPPLKALGEIGSIVEDTGKCNAQPIVDGKTCLRPPFVL
jgi:hypothetical protein